jgi:transcriptional regulator GlxA family with amidase domain
VAPATVKLLLEWGVDEFRHLGEMPAPATIRRLEVRAGIADSGARIREALCERIDPGKRAEVERIVDATLAGIVRRERSVPRLASRLYVSRSSLERFMRSAGLVPPSTFLIRTRLIVAALLRTDPRRRARAWSALGFYSSGHLSNQFRAHFGRTLMQTEGSCRNELVPELIGGLLSGDPASGGANLGDSLLI